MNFGVRCVVLAVLCAVVLTPSVQGHLRYVMNPSEISKVGTGSGYSLAVADQLGIAMLVGLLFVSTIQMAGPRLSRARFFATTEKWLESLAPYSVIVGRILVALLLLGSWYAGTLLTPQFGLAQARASSAVVSAELVAGLLLLMGLLIPLGAVLLAIIYLSTFAALGIHGLDHLAMLGLAVFFFLEGGGSLSLDTLLSRNSNAYAALVRQWKRYRDYSLMALRIALGTSLVWLGLTEKVLAPALTSYAIVKYGVPYFPDLTIFTFLFGALEILLGFHFVLGIFNRVISVIYLVLLVSAIPIFGEWLNHFALFAAALILLTRGAGPFRIGVHFSRRA